MADTYTPTSVNENESTEAQVVEYTKVITAVLGDLLRDYEDCGAIRNLEQFMEVRRKSTSLMLLMNEQWLKPIPDGNDRVTWIKKIHNELLPKLQSRGIGRVGREELPL